MKQTSKKGLKNQIGGYGEQIAANYLTKQGFSIVEQNYLKKWGEIDIVARETANKSIIIHFVEVKTVSYETKPDLERAVFHGTWRPEENVHYKKIQRLNRAIESWIVENDYNGDWQIDVCSVRVVPREKYATVMFLPNVIL
jgi:putative endonuclease